MKLTEAISYIEPYTVICLTHKNMTEDWYRSLRFIPESVKERNPEVLSIGAIHPERNEFRLNEPAIRLYLND